MKTIFALSLFLISLPVLAAPDINVNKTVDLPSVSGGQTVEYTLTATNQGDTTATGLQVTDQLPANATYISDDEPNGQYDSGTSIWNIGSLAAGATVVLKIIAVVY
jgi:uncharacterized repeat protein (TIGR01451 family)